MKHWVKAQEDVWLPTWDIVIDNLNACPAEWVNVLDDLGVVVHHVCTQEYANVYQLASVISKQNNNISVSAQTMISFTTRSTTYGKHNDEVDVYFLQAIGQTEFSVWEDETQYDYVLNPGDLIHVPKGLYHSTKPLTPRVGISYGVED
jgi:cupin superfamily acireductone dioxygenase involved in methionine salvage